MDTEITPKRHTDSIKGTGLSLSTNNSTSPSNEDIIDSTGKLYGSPNTSLRDKYESLNEMLKGAGGAAPNRV